MPCEGPVPSAARSESATNATAWLRALAEGSRGRAAALIRLLSACALLLTIAFLTPGASESATLDATAQTLLTLSAAGAAWLVRRRFLQTHRRSDLFLAAAILSFGLVRLIACAIPGALDLRSGRHLAAAALCGELLAFALLAAAAFTARWPLLIVRHPGRLLAAMTLATMGAAALSAVSLSSYLVGAHTFSADATARHPLAIAVVIAAAALLVSAGAGFSRDAHAGRDRSRWLLAGASMLMAAALLSQLNGALAPGSDLAADALRIISLGLIAGAALHWELEARSLAARAAVVAERQRVAWDLHDGLVQDLAFIAAHGERMAAEYGEEHPVVIAARRALQISRCAIADLSDPGAATAHEALEAVASELRRRFEIVITLEVQLRNELPAEARDHVSRIVREGITNAARHGGAQAVLVSLREEEGHVRLRVQDDGRGIDAVPGGRRPEGFGLRSIHERAAGLGGHMEVSQHGERGTVLDVVLS